MRELWPTLKTETKYVSSMAQGGTVQETNELDFTFSATARRIDEAILRENFLTAGNLICTLIRRVLHELDGQNLQRNLRSVRKRWGHIIDIDRYLENIEYAENHPHYSGYDFEKLDDNCYPAEVYIANKTEDDFKNLSIDIDPLQLDDLSSILRSGGFGYVSISSIIRHAVTRHLHWIFGIPNMTIALRSIYRPRLAVAYAQRMQLESHFYIALDVVQRLVNLGKCSVSGLDEVRNSIRRFRSTYWRKHYLYQFDKRFRPRMQSTESPRR